MRYGLCVACKMNKKDLILIWYDYDTQNSNWWSQKHSHRHMWGQRGKKSEKKKKNKGWPPKWIWESERILLKNKKK